jgi:hypothetical protein
MTSGVICRDFRGVWPDDINGELAARMCEIFIGAAEVSRSAARSDLTHPSPPTHSMPDRKTCCAQDLREGEAVPLQKCHSQTRSFSNRKCCQRACACFSQRTPTNEQRPGDADFIARSGSLSHLGPSTHASAPNPKKFAARLPCILLLFYAKPTRSGHVP